MTSAATREEQLIWNSGTLRIGKTTSPTCMCLHVPPSETPTQFLQRLYEIHRSLIQQPSDGQRERGIPHQQVVLNELHEVFTEGMVGSSYNGMLNQELTRVPANITKSLEIAAVLATRLESSKSIQDSAFNQRIQSLTREHVRVEAAAEASREPLIPGTQIPSAAATLTTSVPQAPILHEPDASRMIRPPRTSSNQQQHTHQGSSQQQQQQRQQRSCPNCFDFFGSEQFHSRSACPIIQAGLRAMNSGSSSRPPSTQGFSHVQGGGRTEIATRAVEAQRANHEANSQSGQQRTPLIASNQATQSAPSSQATQSAATPRGGPFSQTLRPVATLSHVRNDGVQVFHAQQPTIQPDVGHAGNSHHALSSGHAHVTWIFSESIRAVGATLMSFLTEGFDSFPNLLRECSVEADRGRSNSSGLGGYRAGLRGLDHGATFDLMDILTAKRLNLPILPSPLRLQNSTSTNGNVLSITPLVSFCYGCEFLETPTGIISAPRPMLVTEGLHNLYSVLISNTDTLRFRGRVDYDTNTYTLNHPDGQVITLPITQHSI